MKKIALYMKEISTGTKMLQWIYCPKRKAKEKWKSKRKTLCSFFSFFSLVWWKLKRKICLSLTILFVFKLPFFWFQSESKPLAHELSKFYLIKVFFCSWNVTLFLVMLILCKIKNQICLAMPFPYSSFFFMHF